MPASFAWETPTCVGLAVLNLFTLLYRPDTLSVLSNGSTSEFRSTPRLALATLQLCQVQTKLDILRHSIRKLQTYEEVHIVFAWYPRCDGVSRFLSAGGNDCYDRTCYRASRVYESSSAVSERLAQEAKLAFGLRENVRADEILIAFLELQRAIHEFAVSLIP